MIPTDRTGRLALEAVSKIADRLDALAETAELMGDDAGASRLREQAADIRLEAMSSLDGGLHARRGGEARSAR